MGREGRDAPVNHSGAAPAGVSPRAERAPRFDRDSIQRARPAVPLGARGLLARGGRLGLPALVLIACLAGLVGGVAGMLVFQNRSAAGDGVQKSTPRAAAGDESRAAEAPRAETANAGAPQPADAGREAAGVDTSAQTTAEAGPAGAGFDEGRERAELRAALGGWVEATNARDVGRQMSYYNPRLEAFYLTRDTPASSVRAEKERVFRRTGQVRVEASEPSITVAPDGRTATMRFRKRYRIEDRAGEVVQELRWLKTADGWKIISERDLRVIN